MTANSSSSPDGGSFHDEELDEYRQVYLDETDEELEHLVQVLLSLEEDPQNENAVNEAFRLLHTMKGTSGLMGYVEVSDLCHQLENRFDLIRIHEETLSPGLINLALRATDFLKSYLHDLRRTGTSTGTAAPLISALTLPDSPSAPAPVPVKTASPAVTTAPSSKGTMRQSLGGAYRVRVSFRTGLQLADLKARLILSRLANIGEIVGSDPAVEDLSSMDHLSEFTILFSSDREPDDIRRIANVDGVETVEIVSGLSAAQTPAPAPELSAVSEPADALETTEPASSEASQLEPSAPNQLVQTNPAGTVEVEAVTSRAVAETVRVEVHRLDRLMNLTGELLVTNAHFSQLTMEMLPMFKRGGLNSKLKDLGDRLRQRLKVLSNSADPQAAKGLIDEFAEDLEMLEDQTTLWEEGRNRFTQIAEAVDQLSRVSNNLQKRVLDTRMVPVGPLFNRFKRVVRDLAVERDKRVQLDIRGERTELDKRMIDELGDPLLHLLRNSIDHGLETQSERQRLGKPEVGTIILEASHRGNNVFINIRDDGAGLNIEKIRQKILKQNLLTASELAQLTEPQIIDFIWKPGFSTAAQVTDISGRGVGMDIVKNRIQELSGSIEVTSVSGKGTCFSIRLPLTLAIIRCLMVRFRDGVFSLPLEDVREIVFVPYDKIHTVHRRQTIEVRGQFIPFARMDTIFSWNNQTARTDVTKRESDSGAADRGVNVVILQFAGRMLGLCVDELLGSANIVVKSLTENFQNIVGLSGASVKGDGTVCLMLDTAAVFELATRSSRSQASELMAPAQ